MGYFNDGSITYENLIKRTNGDLANTLGNLVSRTGAMIKQYFGGVIPENNGNDDEFAISLKTTLLRVPTWLSSVVRLSWCRG
jgi:methionyl-tRNA synthetase